MSGDTKNKKDDSPEGSIAQILSEGGFSVAIVSSDVTYEELDAILPKKRAPISEN